MKTAFLYAGQGSQHKGMGKDLYDEFEEFREVFDSAELDFDLKKVCFEDPDEQISITKYTQPCMVAFATGVTAILNKKGIRPDIMAGLSLGEYSALSAAGVWDAKQTISLVAFRGEAMTRSAEGVDAAMNAIIGMDRETLQECVDEAAGSGVVSICNDNCPGQIVIGGEKAAVDEAARIAKEKGAKRCMPLNVSGPFHTKFMDRAADELREKFKETEFGKETIPVVFNYIGRERNENETIQELLEAQVKNGVMMTSTLKYMLDKGVRRFVEIGPGKALTGFVKKTAKAMGIEDVVFFNVETVEDINNLVENW
ncbi:MAG: ACP S-malonyltransferase [Lachnospiraceae bacterium]|nr:ACP S-malonyltransferase [Lachnospiraceae bacterium]